MTTNPIETLQQMPPWEWPEEAAVWIRQALQAEDPVTRSAATQLAPGVMDDEMARALIGLVRADAAEEVAAAAAIALGPALEECSVEYDEGLADALPGMNDEILLSREVYAEVRQTLEAVYRDADRPVVARRRALEAAVRAPQPWQVDATRAAHQSDDLGWQQTALFCMGFLGGFEALILEALKSDQPGLVFEAIRAAGNQGLEPAGEQILGLAGEVGADHDLRLAAVAALETLDPPGSQELLEALVAGDDEELAEAATNTLEERLIFADLEDDGAGEDFEDDDDDDGDDGDDDKDR